MFDNASWPDALVSAQHHQRPESLLPCSLGVREAVLERVLRREEGHDALPRHVESDVGHEVAQVVFFLRTDGVVGQEDERAVASQAANGVIGIDPRIHALGRRQLRPGRAQFGGEHRRPGTKRCEQIEGGQRSQAWRRWVLSTSSMRNRSVNSARR